MNSYFIHLFLYIHKFHHLSYLTKKSISLIFHYFLKAYFLFVNNLRCEVLAILKNYRVKINFRFSIYLNLTKLCYFIITVFGTDYQFTTFLTIQLLIDFPIKY